MRVVMIAPWYGEKMGYIENRLPAAMAALGVETHLITSTLQPHFNNPQYGKIYEPINGPAVQPEGTSVREGFTFHRLPCRAYGNHIRIAGLAAKLKELKPDVVQTFAALSATSFEASFLSGPFGFKFFTSAHVCASVFMLTRKGADRSFKKRLLVGLTRTLPGRLIGWSTSTCYAATVDCLDVAVRYFGVPRSRAALLPLGVETDLFHPVSGDEDAAERVRLRHQYGFGNDEIVCIYTGRFGNDKNPVCLAQAIEKLVDQGLPFRGLFVGGGEQEAEIAACRGCVVQPFVPWPELPRYYRAAEIGVWPAEESTSMLDAAASGLPIVVSHRVQATERYEGNGSTYQQGDPSDLARALAAYADPAARAQAGEFGTRKIRENFSWSANAGRRLRDYKAALGD